MQGAPGTAGLPAWMQYKRNLLPRPTYDVVSRSYQHFRIPRPPDLDPPASMPGMICWGAVGDMPSAELMPSVDFNVKHEKWTETNRESEIVRVENPDDPSQYVMEDRPKQVAFDAEKNEGKPAPNTASETPEGLNQYPPQVVTRFVTESITHMVTINMVYLNDKGLPDPRLRPPDPEVPP